jgi:hypothetical protein
VWRWTASYVSAPCVKLKSRPPPRPSHRWWPAHSHASTRLVLTMPVRLGGHGQNPSLELPNPSQGIVMRKRGRWTVFSDARTGKHLLFVKGDLCLPYLENSKRWRDALHERISQASQYTQVRRDTFDAPTAGGPVCLHARPRSQQMRSRAAACAPLARSRAAATQHVARRAPLVHL